MRHNRPLVYRVVGCSDCSALWVIEGDPETSECPRCGRRRPREKRRSFFESDDANAAREARARLLAERQDAEDAFAAVDDFATLEGEIDAAGPDDETYLAQSGIDPDAVAEAAERTEGQANSGSRESIVREAIREVGTADEAAIERYCEARDVPPEAVADLLDKLVRAGEVTREDGTYRLL